MKNIYFNIFKIDDNCLNSLIATALSSGGDYCDLYFENTTYFNILLKDGVVSSGGFHTDYGVGIRVLNGEKTGYAYSESTKPDDMAKAAKAASMIAVGTEGGRRYEGYKVAPVDCYPEGKSWRDVPTGEFLPFLKKIEERIFAKEKRAIKVIARLTNSVSDVLMYNSLGELTVDTRPMGSLSVSVVFKQGEKSINTSASRSYRKWADMIEEKLIDEIVGDCLKDIDAKFQAKRPNGGQMSVVLGAGASGILLHEAMGHAFEADFNRKGQSIFADKMGKRVCPEGINIVDDGTLMWNRGSGNYDDEGIAGEKTYMVTDGILTSFLHDRISAAWYGVKPTGNGRRENFRYNPLPRMRATYMESGDWDTQNIISSVKKGVYVDEFSNGQVKIGEGDFTFYVKSGWVIENGRLTMPINDINIVGNGPRALEDIVAVGNDFKIDNGNWTCGKEQSVPVSCGMPTVLVKNLIVGGK